MKVLVTGGTGFTGSHLTRRLIERGCDVTVIDNQPGLFYDELRELGASIHIGSVTDKALVDSAMDGCEAVYHIAAMFRKVNLPKQVYWDVNVEGTRIVAQAALNHGVHTFVNCSTCGVHGNVQQREAGEDAPIAPADYYQLTKYEGERALSEYVGRGMKITTIRPTAIYGPGDPERFLMLFKRAKTGRFVMFGDGKVFYHPVYIDNLVDAFELAAQSEAGDGEAYLIGDESPYQLNDLVTAIGDSLGVRVKITHVPFWPLWVAALLCEAVYKPLSRDPPLFRRRVDWFRQNRSFSIARARRDLGYKPRVGLQEGLAQTAQWYREKGYI